MSDELGKISHFLSEPVQATREMVRAIEEIDVKYTDHDFHRLDSEAKSRFWIPTEKEGQKEFRKFLAEVKGIELFHDPETKEKYEPLYKAATGLNKQVLRNNRRETGMEIAATAVGLLSLAGYIWVQIKKNKAMYAPSFPIMIMPIYQFQGWQQCDPFEDPLNCDLPTT